MWLRRITSNLQQQNWLALFLDFLVVVSGIFVALQVDGWNQWRQDRQREQVTLQQLHNDFRTSALEAKSMYTRHQETVDSLEWVIEVIVSGELADEDRQRFFYSFASMYQLPPLGVSMGGFDAMIASGDFALIQDPKLKSMLVDLKATLEMEQSLLVYFRDNNRLDMAATRGLVQVVPNEESSGTRVQINFDQMAGSGEVLTVVASQQRNHQIFADMRLQISQNFERIEAYIKNQLATPRSIIEVTD